MQLLNNNNNNILHQKSSVDCHSRAMPAALMRLHGRLDENSAKLLFRRVGLSLRLRLHLSISISLSLSLHWRIDYCDLPCAAAALGVIMQAQLVRRVHSAGWRVEGALLSFILNDSFTHVGGCRRCSHQSPDCPAPPSVPASFARLSDSLLLLLPLPLLLLQWLTLTLACQSFRVDEVRV